MGQSEIRFSVNNEVRNLSFHDPIKKVTSNLNLSPLFSGRRPKRKPMWFMMADFIKSLVSKKKKRYVTSKYNLDLTYIGGK